MAAVMPLMVSRLYFLSIGAHHTFFAADESGVGHGVARFGVRARGREDILVCRVTADAARLVEGLVAVASLGGAE